MFLKIHNIFWIVAAHPLISVAFKYLWNQRNKIHVLLSLQIHRNKINRKKKNIFMKKIKTSQFKKKNNTTPES